MQCRHGASTVIPNHSCSCAPQVTRSLGSAGLRESGACISVWTSGPWCFLSSHKSHYSDGYFCRVLRALAVVSQNSPSGLCRDGRNYLCPPSTLILCSPLPGDWLHCYRRFSLSFHNFHGAGKLSLHRLHRFEAIAMRNGSNWTIAEMPVFYLDVAFIYNAQLLGLLPLLLAFCKSSSAARGAFGSLGSVNLSLSCPCSLWGCWGLLSAGRDQSSLCWLHTVHPSLHHSGLA